MESTKRGPGPTPHPTPGAKTPPSTRILDGGESAGTTLRCWFVLWCKDRRVAAEPASSDSTEYADTTFNERHDAGKSSQRTPGRRPAVQERFTAPRRGNFLLGEWGPSDPLHTLSRPYKRGGFPRTPVRGLLPYALTPTGGGQIRPKAAVEITKTFPRMA